MKTLEVVEGIHSGSRPYLTGAGCSTVEPQPVTFYIFSVRAANAWHEVE